MLARKTSTCFSMSLGDVFRNGYYVDPEYVQESGDPFCEDNALEESIVSTLLEHKSILIYGEAGYGKTTILAKSFLKHVERFKSDTDYNMPFYLWLKDKNANYHFDFSQYIDESFAENLNLQPYPFLDLSDISPCFYLDGFDELAEEIPSTSVKRISTSSIFSHPLLLTSRIQYVRRYLGNYDLMNHFAVQIKINKWDAEKAKGYINNFCAKKGTDKSFSERVYGLLANNSELCSLLDSPLLITMLLWVIESNRMTIPETISTRVQLFQALHAFLRHFRSQQKEQYFLRRIDLLTMYQLMESRGSVKPVTEGIIAELERLVFNPIFSDQPEFQQKIEEMFLMVKKEFTELSQ